jgi:uncharacterized membrane protein YciS (DUF1049 family)
MGDYAVASVFLAGVACGVVVMGTVQIAIIVAARAVRRQRRQG